jgi:DNA-binding NtrC family response regulator
MQRKILVVGRHTVASSTVSELLGLQRYLVEENEGEKALSTIRHEKYAIIISYILSDGLRVLETAKAISPAAPVVLVSNEHIPTGNEAIQLGAFELIEKTDLVFEQLTEIKRVLDRAISPESALAVG